MNTPYFGSNHSAAHPVSSIIGPTSFPLQPMHTLYFGQPLYGSVMQPAQPYGPVQPTSSISAAQYAFGSYNSPQVFNGSIGTQFGQSGSATVLGQQTIVPHAFTAGTLHDPPTGAWNMDT
ncbi:hypothetical protein Tco_0682599, partial [Tanacetum coccineum]